MRSLLVTSDALDPECHPPTRVGGKGSTQYQSIHEIDDSSLGSTLRYSTVFWVGCEDGMNEPLSTQTLQHRHIAAANSVLVPSCFLLDEAERLMSFVGSSFLNLDREHVSAHQSIVTASLLAEISGRKIHFRTAKRLERQLVQDPSLFHQGSILMLTWRRYDLKNAAIVKDIYARVKEFEPCSLRVFPSAEELEHVHGKIDDIRALDQIARNSPPKWAFRPTTCDCTSVCHLSQAGVLKRTHSCGSEHVIVHPTASDLERRLKCQSDRRRTSKRQAAQTTERWFHQEYVEGLRNIGEFRVFIVTMKDATGTRGRRGRVIELVHTLELADRELVVTVLGSGSSWRGKSNACKIDPQELREFALYVFDALRSVSDWSTGFESLEVGARVDVGVTIIGGVAQYFVNEVTRIYEADCFAEWLAQPGTHICRAVSEALAEVFVAPANR